MNSPTHRRKEDHSRQVHMVGTFCGPTDDSVRVAILDSSHTLCNWDQENFLEYWEPIPEVNKLYGLPGYKAMYSSHASLHTKRGLHVGDTYVRYEYENDMLVRAIVCIDGSDDDND